jgi:hypothetical protein
MAVLFVAAASVVGCHQEVSMGTLFYKDYAITPGAIRDDTTGKYAPTVHLMWRRADGKRETNSFTLPERCDTFSDANVMALEKAKAWADRWLTPSEPIAKWTEALKAVDHKRLN